MKTLERLNPNGGRPLTAIFLLLFTLAASAVAQNTTVNFVYEGPGAYEGTEDTLIDQQNGNSSVGGSASLKVGGDSTAQPVKSLIRFDISSLAGRYTAITGATLKMQVELTRGSWTNQSFNLYRVSNANRTWKAGTATSASTSQTGVSSWNHRLRTTATWAGSAGLATSGTDFVATPVATASLSSTSTGTWITWTFTDVSFLDGWAETPANNAGFLLRCPALETVTQRFAQFYSANAAAASRPVFSVTMSGFEQEPSWDVNYTLPSASKVSTVIYNSSGEVVRELLHTADRPAGSNSEPWNGRDERGTLVADGTYNYKVLATPGLIAQYKLSIGSNVPVTYDPWPGNHASVTCVAVDSTGVYFGGGESEGPPMLVKTDVNGNRIWTATDNWVVPWMGFWSLSADNGRLYARQQDGRVMVFSTSTAPTPTPIANWNLLYNSSDSIDPDNGQRYSMDLSVRASKMMMSYVNHNVVRWINTTNGSVIRTVSVASPTGVAVANNGTFAYVCSGGDRILKVTDAGVVTTFKTFTAGMVPFRLDVVPSSGDVLVAFQGTDQKVRRYTSSGTLLGTAGNASAPGPRQGLYDPTRFVDINDIAVGPDGTWWMAEPSWEPRRVSRFSNTTLMKEFYGGYPYASYAVADPDDPTTVWISNVENDCLTKTQVNYTTKTWKVISTHSYLHPLINDATSGFGYSNQKWEVRKRNGVTYLCYGKVPVILKHDPVAGTLVPVAASGAARNRNDASQWYIPANLRPTDGSTPYLFSWADLNGDTIATLNEMTFSNTIVDNFSQSGATSGISTDFTYTGSLVYGYASPLGPGTISPSSWTAGGAPVYSWANLTHPTNGYPADDRHEGVGFIRDSGGNYYGAYNTQWRSIGGLPYGVGFWSERVGGNKIVKWNAAGTRQWMVGRHAATNSAAPGQMMYLWGIAGVAKDCVFAIDSENSLVHVYDRDGLYVGAVLDNQSSDSPASAYKLCGENFSGSVYEYPGNGSVLYFGGYDNTSRVYEITGWNNWVRTSGTVVKSSN